MCIHVIKNACNVVWCEEPESALIVLVLLSHPESIMSPYLAISKIMILYEVYT